MLRMEFLNDVSNDQMPVSTIPVTGEMQLRSKSLHLVLIVGYDKNFSVFLKDNLARTYQIKTVADGREGWQKVLSSQPQLIVMDVAMPDMNGLDLCRKIKRDSRTCHIPLILLTFMSSEQDQISGLEAGADDYLTRPCNIHILNAKINNLLTLNRRFRDTYSKQIRVLHDDFEVESTDARLINSIFKYISANLDNTDFSVEELSKHVAMCRGSLYRKMKRLTGMSPLEYVRSVKLDKAAVLLEKSNLNVTQIAYMIGFETPAYFTRMFKERFQMGPRQYICLKRRKIQ